MGAPACSDLGRPAVAQPPALKGVAPAFKTPGDPRRRPFQSPVPVSAHDFRPYVEVVSFPCTAIKVISLPDD